MEPRGIEPRLSAFQTDAITILAQVPLATKLKRSFFFSYPPIYHSIGRRGGSRTHNLLIISQLLLPCNPLRHSPGSTGGIRTHTELILSQVPLPLGYSAIWSIARESNPAVTPYQSLQDYKSRPSNQLRAIVGPTKTDKI